MLPFVFTLGPLPRNLWPFLWLHRQPTVEVQALLMPQEAQVSMRLLPLPQALPLASVDVMSTEPRVVSRQQPQLDPQLLPFSYATTTIITHPVLQQLQGLLIPVHHLSWTSPRRNRRATRRDTLLHHHPHLWDGQRKSSRSAAHHRWNRPVELEAITKTPSWGGRRSERKREAAAAEKIDLISCCYYLTYLCNLRV